MTPAGPTCLDDAHLLAQAVEDAANELAAAYEPTEPQLGGVA